MIETTRSFTPDWVSSPGDTIADLLGDFRERKYLGSASFDFAQLTISQLVERSRNQRRRYLYSCKSP
ncbi:hypothetical protein G7B40_035005 [Aetokthonos hydrillicola Thurmond2011]|jgi:hypothetical protein|uniref:Uncharacterized protein n=1 Tax=Aetokthonos hydrillicola Thurmond2011 TaxID=2712845 RepID=A0AAP5IDY1_9CYAN|nr:hypothetical protein [Aetokthonos hydrillicola]MBW4590441.1 hypothetical protein [Aetokthonos hydrillicola CCALA 1050]MDR9899731.1 hypothetical protein [Aetokthonos hydrillicola Thurmond2011]